MTKTRKQLEKIIREARNVKQEAEKIAQKERARAIAAQVTIADTERLLRKLIGW